MDSKEEPKLGASQLNELLTRLQNPEKEWSTVSERDLVCYAVGVLEPDEIPPAEQAIAASTGIRRRLERIRAGMATFDAPEWQLHLAAAKQRALARTRDLQTDTTALSRNTFPWIIGILFRQPIDFERVQNGLTRALGAAVSLTSVPAAALATRGSEETPERPALRVDIFDEDLETLAEALYDGLRPGVSYSIARGGNRRPLTISDGESKRGILKKLMSERR